MARRHYWVTPARLVGWHHYVYALKPASSMHPSAGAILRAASPEAEPGDLDLQISATHLFNPAQSPTSSAIVLAVAVTQPESAGYAPRTVTRAARRSSGYDLLGTPRDMRRMTEGVHISRRIGRDETFHAVADASIMPLAPSSPTSRR